MPGSSSTHLQKASFSHSQDHGRDAGAAVRDAACSAGLGIHPELSHGLIFSRSYNALPCSSRKSWRACAATGKRLCLAPDTCCCAGISDPPSSAPGLSCTQEALLWKGWKQALSLHKRITNHQLDPQRVQAAALAPPPLWLYVGAVRSEAFCNPAA